MVKINRVGVDIGKNCFHACAVTRQGEVVWRKVFKRVTWIDHLTKLIEPDVDIGMEACGGAHHWAHTLQQRGHRVRLIAPQFVKPYVQSNKTDNADAEAIAEAMSRPKMRFVPSGSGDYSPMRPNIREQSYQQRHQLRCLQTRRSPYTRERCCTNRTHQTIHAPYFSHTTTLALLFNYVK